MKLFSGLNSEKPTPIFLSLARSSNSSSKLENILDDSGAPFVSNDARTERIVRYFEDIYKKPDTDITNYENCITDFLGNDIANHPMVSNSKLSDSERISLEFPLMVEELDKSVDKCNVRSAPGIDGFSNMFIKKFWAYFRIPLHKYSLCCYEKGALTSNFRSASIKLIPKKGEATQLKNWRPISLLSNFYKIISRAINNRINGIVNRICSRAQKGFNNQRYTQECLINVIETIQHCHKNNVEGALVAVDMAKAFDTLSHGYLREVFNFFNFGPNIIKWLSLLGENRSASILLDNGEYSRPFELGKRTCTGR
jgi:hypothetical protein